MAEDKTIVINILNVYSDNTDNNMAYSANDAGNEMRRTRRSNGN